MHASAGSMNAWPPMLGHLFRRRRWRQRWYYPHEMVEWMRQASTLPRHPVALSRRGVRIVLKIEVEGQSDQQPPQTLHTHSVSVCLSFFAVGRSSSWFFLALSRVCSRWIPLEVSNIVSVKRAGSTTTTNQHRRCDFFLSLVSLRERVNH